MLIVILAVFFLSSLPLYQREKITISSESQTLVPLAINTTDFTYSFLVPKGSTLKEALASKGVTLGEFDYLSLSPSSLIEAETIVQLIRVKEKTISEEEEIPYPRRFLPASDLPFGQRQIIQKGVVGLKKITYFERQENGQTVYREKIGEETIRPPLEQVEAVGLFRESDVSAVLVSLTYPMPQDDDYMIMEATAYCPLQGETDGNPWNTSVGVRSGYGIVAVDPTVIPYFTPLYIEGYGYAVAGDTGGAIKGNRIDLFFYTSNDAQRFGRRTVKVWIVK